jgi:Pup amidohydrolase
MKKRIYGYETEYGVMIFPETGAKYAPKRMSIYDYLEFLIGTFMKVLPATYRKRGVFMENGGLFNYEALHNNFLEGLTEMATPECASPRDVSLYHAAQTSLLFRLIRKLNDTIGTLDPSFRGRIALGKSNVDSEGRYFASHENYLVHDDPGPAATALLYLLTPVLWLFHLILMALAYLPIIIMTPLFFILALAAGLLSGILSANPRYEGLNEKLTRRLAFIFDKDVGVDYLVRLSGDISKLLFAPWIFLASRLLAPFMFNRYKEELSSYLATRTIFCGTGKVFMPVMKEPPLARAEGDAPPAVFEISQRAEAMKCLFSVVADEDRRPVFDGRDLFLDPLSALSRKKRLHILFSDSNMSSLGVYLKMGVTGLILEMIEEGAAFEEVRLADPMAALKDVSKDPSLRKKLPLKNGREASALEIQRFYLARAKEYFLAADAEDPMAKDIIDKWEYVLGCLEVNPHLLYRKLDWVTKRDLIEEVLRGRGTIREIAEIAEWASYFISHCDMSFPPDGASLLYFKGLLGFGVFKQFQDFLDNLGLAYEEFVRRWKLYYEILKIDFKFHQLDEEGYYYQLLNSGLVEDIFTPLEVEEAITRPPQETRARIRGTIVSTYGHKSETFSHEEYGEKMMTSRTKVGWDKFFLEWPFKKLSFKDPFNADFSSFERQLDFWSRV